MHVPPPAPNPLGTRRWLVSFDFVTLPNYCRSWPIMLTPWRCRCRCSCDSGGEGCRCGRGAVGTLVLHTGASDDRPPVCFWRGCSQDTTEHGGFITAAFAVLVVPSPPSPPGVSWLIEGHLCGESRNIGLSHIVMFLPCNAFVTRLSVTPWL